MRLATPADADAVADYHDRCFRDTYAVQILAGEIDVPAAEGTRLQLQDWFGPGSKFETHVAVVDGVPVGHFTLLDAQLVHLFVEPEHQGMGLGRRLLALGEAALESGGHSEFELHARVENANAIAFYLALGWEMTDQLVHTDEHGISYDEHVLIKHASPTSE